MLVSGDVYLKEVRAGCYSVQAYIMSDARSHKISFVDYPAHRRDYLNICAFSSFKCFVWQLDVEYVTCWVGVSQHLVVAYFGKNANGGGALCCKSIVGDAHY